jgi:hypothetical protein
MTKGPSPLLGYNTNVRHKGRVFHIQTEDSGVSHPHVITHLFADGGRILKSNKTSYADIVTAPDMAVQVKKIMQDQHKAMFIALRDGQFDHLFEAGVADSKEANAPAVSGDLLSSAQVSGSEPARKVSSPTLSEPKPTSAPAATATAAPAASAVAVVDAPKRTSSVAIPALKPPMPPGVTAMDAPVRSPSAAPASPSRPSVAPPPGATSRPPSQRPPPRPAGASGHYQAVRAPEILGSFKPRDEGATAPSSIFGDGLMSEKSLDEVILAYLAEDLDDSKR